MVDDPSKKDIVNGDKVKTSKNEIMQSKVGAYLIDRNYTTKEKFQKFDFTLLHTGNQFALSKMIEEDTSRGNSFLYSNVLCLTKHYNIVEQHFGRFVNFVQSQQDTVKNELRSLFGPVICHIYIELLKGKEWKPASDFLHKYAHLVAPIDNLNAPLPSKVNGCSVNSNVHDSTSSSFPTATTQILFMNESTGNPVCDQFKEIIRNLSTCLKIESVDSTESLVLFRKSKYDIEMSLLAINLLKKFFETQGHVIILNILHTWTHFTIKDFREDSEEPYISNRQDLARLRMLRNKSGIDKPAAGPKITPSTSVKTSPEKRNTPANKFLKRLSNSMVKLERMDISKRTFKIIDNDKGLSSATIDSGECHIAAGFQNSTVKLWQLYRSFHRERNLYGKIQSRLCDWSIQNQLESNEDDNTMLSREQEDFYNKKREENSFDDFGGITLRGHSRGVTDVTFSKRFPLLFSTSKDSTIRLWKSEDYTCGAVYRGHNYPIWCISEAPIGSYFATGSRDYTARLWNIDHEFPLLTYVGHTQDVDCVAFHPNGNYIATGSCDLSVRLWSVSTGKLLRVFTECQYPVTSIAFSPNGKFLAAAGEDSKVKIYDLATGSQIFELKNHIIPVTSVAWNSNGSKIVTCCFDGTVFIWDVTKIGVGDQPSSIGKKTFYASGCRHAVKVFFNSNDTISCIGSSQTDEMQTSQAN